MSVIDRNRVTAVYLIKSVKLKLSISKYVEGRTVPIKQYITYCRNPLLVLEHLLFHHPSFHHMISQELATFHHSSPLKITIHESVLNIKPVLYNKYRIKGTNLGLQDLKLFTQVLCFTGPVPGFQVSRVKCEMFWRV